MVRKIGTDTMRYCGIGYCAIMSLMAIATISMARDIQETVLKAHKLYEQGEVDQALERYDSIEKKGSATWYNMALCHFYKENFVEALVCLKKAERIASWTELPDVYSALDRLSKPLNLPEDARLSHAIYRMVARMLSLMSLYGWQLLFLVAWIALLFLAGRLSRSRSYISLMTLSMVVIVSAGALYMKHDVCNATYGIVLKDNLVVYAGPDDAFHELATLSKTKQIAVCECQDKWMKIYSDKCTGWVCQDSIAIV